MYFSYIPERDGFRFHDTASEAKRQAERELEIEREGAVDEAGWGDNVTEICWGVVSERVTETLRRERPPADELDDAEYDADGTCWSRFDVMVDYDLLKPKE